MAAVAYESRALQSFSEGPAEATDARDRIPRPELVCRRGARAAGAPPRRAVPARHGGVADGQTRRRTVRVRPFSRRAEILGQLRGCDARRMGRVDGGPGARRRARVCVFQQRHRRSEEHTSELQSRFGISYAVFCLKKKQTTANNPAIMISPTCATRTATV